MELRILGPLEVADGDRTVPVTGARQRALLCVLLLHANQVVSADRLLDDVWGRPGGDGAPASGGARERLVSLVPADP